MTKILSHNSADLVEAENLLVKLRRKKVSTYSPVCYGTTHRASVRGRQSSKISGNYICWGGLNIPILHKGANIIVALMTKDFNDRGYGHHVNDQNKFQQFCDYLANRSAYKKAFITKNGDVLGSSHGYFDAHQPSCIVVGAMLLWKFAWRNRNPTGMWCELVAAGMDEDDACIVAFNYVNPQIQNGMPYGCSSSPIVRQSFSRIGFKNYKAGKVSYGKRVVWNKSYHKIGKYRNNRDDTLRRVWNSRIGPKNTDYHDKLYKYLCDKSQSFDTINSMFGSDTRKSFSLLDNVQHIITWLSENR